MNHSNINSILPIFEYHENLLFLIDGNTLSSIAPSVNYHQPILQGENPKDVENSKKNSGVVSTNEHITTSNLETNNQSSSRVTDNTDARIHYSTPAPPPPPPPPPSEAPPSMPQGTISQ